MRGLLYVICFLTILSQCLPATAIQPNFPVLRQLINKNHQWARRIRARWPRFFIDSAKTQKPKVLWIGCSDSRVPESVITQSLPGAIFVHRNIANMIPNGDSNSLAVLEYAVDHLGVEHIIIAGHTNCGGATASLDAAKARRDPRRTIPNLPISNPLNKWLTPLTRAARSIVHRLPKRPPGRDLQLFVEHNIRVQVRNVIQSKVVRKAAEDAAAGKRKKVWVHGWVYDLRKGEIRDLGATHGPYLGDHLQEVPVEQVPVEKDRPSVIDDTQHDGQ